MHSCPVRWVSSLPTSADEETAAERGSVAELGWNLGLSPFSLENGGDPDPAGWAGETGWLGVSAYFLCRKSWGAWP